MWGMPPITTTGVSTTDLIRQARELMLQIDRSLRLDAEDSEVSKEELAERDYSLGS